VEGSESKPVLHRDLKPANILLDADLNVKMADFGLAKELSSNTQFAQTNVGTPFYMAPEIINDKKYDEKSDIWSLGCLLYELAALRPPFEAANAVSLAVKINQGRFARIPSRYSDSLFDVIRQMIQLDPRRRPRVEDLENIGALQTHMGGARSIWNEYKFQHIQASKLRELKTKEDSLVAREEALNAREAALNVKEQQLALLEQRLKEMQQRLGQQVDVTAAAAATAVPPCNTTALDMNNPKAYNAAKIQAYRRRISMGRQTEQMNIDDDDDDHIAAPVTLDDVPPLPTATTASEPPLPASKPVTSFVPPPPSTSTVSSVNATSTTSTISTRRGPVPVPTMNKLAPFKVLCDNNHGQDHVTHRIAQQVYGTAPANDNNPAKRAPLQTIKISTGAENAKENIQPLASNNIFKFAAVGNKPHSRPLPYDFQVDSEDASPMKKQRVHVSNDQIGAGANHAGGFRFQSNITAAGDYMTAAAHNVDGAKKMYR
jgi:serine/threonine protein kinase